MYKMSMIEEYIFNKFREILYSIRINEETLPGFIFSFEKID